MVWVVIVKFGFSSTEDRDVFIKHFGEAAAHVLEHEPEVLMYRIATLDLDPNKIAIIERYTTKKAWESHLQGEAFKQLSGWLADSGIKADRLGVECYDETTVGFISR